MVAFKFSIGGLEGVTSPSISVTVSVLNSTELGNLLGNLGLYEMSDSNWIGTDSYESISDKVYPSPIAVAQVQNHECADDMPEPIEVTFDIPDDIVARWVNSNKVQVSMAIAPYGEFEYEGFMEIGSNESNYPIKITITPNDPGQVEPYDVSVYPSTLIPNARGTVNMVTPDRSFNKILQENQVIINGVNAKIVSGNDKSMKFIVPENVDGMVELVIADSSGNITSNPISVFVDSSSLRRNKYFPGADTEDETQYSRSAIYNRDLGFNNFAEVTDENSLIQNVYNILLTRKGERLFNPHFGTTIESRIFSLMSEDDEINILQECYSAIEEYEPRVAIDYDQSKVEVDEDGNTARVIIAVVLPEGSSEYIILPFKNRGIYSS